jgi:hypothetical protein
VDTNILVTRDYMDADKNVMKTAFGYGLTGTTLLSLGPASTSTALLRDDDTATFGSNVVALALIGDGRGLTNVPITALVSLTNQFTGTVADFAVPESLVSLAGDLAFTGNQHHAGRVERTIITLLSGGG